MFLKLLKFLKPIRGEWLKITLIIRLKYFFFVIRRLEKLYWEGGRVSGATLGECDTPKGYRGFEFTSSSAFILFNFLIVKFFL